MKFTESYLLLIVIKFCVAESHMKHKKTNGPHHTYVRHYIVYHVLIFQGVSNYVPRWWQQFNFLNYHLVKTPSVE
jgi:hypothetical protein